MRHDKDVNTGLLTLSELRNVRSVRLRVRGTELVRPITKLVPLELA